MQSQDVQPESNDSEEPLEEKNSSKPEEANKRQDKGSSKNIVLGIGGALVALLVIMVSCMENMESEATKQRVKACNNSSTYEYNCEKLLKDDDFEQESSITNPAYVDQFKEKKLKRTAQQRAADTKRAQQSAEISAIIACRNSLKRRLKDPDSLKILGENRKLGLINYSATNSFGGRLQNTFNCQTLENLY